MGDNSKIAWTEATWNCLLGCTKVSPGCDRCYAIRAVHRMAGNPNPKIAEANGDLTLRRSNGKLDWNGTVRLLPQRLEQPLRWSKPRRIFVNSLSDLFHEAVLTAWRDEIFAVMGLAKQHTFQVLTKRPGLMADYLNDPETPARIAESMRVLRGREFRPLLGWPLPNVWLGTSVEDQRRAEERLDHLCRCSAAVRFISAEPLLGPLDLRRWLGGNGVAFVEPYIHWIIGGGESGPGGRWLVERCGNCEGVDPRLMNYQRCPLCTGPDETPTGWRPTDDGRAWATSLRDQCVKAGVAFFWKQWGGPTSHSGGDLLDGRQWHEYPLGVREGAGA